eukprot:10355666-Lingulodinium_polyedra.AAC.1
MPVRRCMRLSSFTSSAATAKDAASHCASAIAELKRCSAAPLMLGEGLPMWCTVESVTPCAVRRWCTLLIS